jgi:hypothetical protein
MIDVVTVVNSFFTKPIHAIMESLHAILWKLLDPKVTVGKVEDFSIFCQPHLDSIDHDTRQTT